MQAVNYEGYFNNGFFYTAGKHVQLPEKRRLSITILEDEQEAVENDNALSEWFEIKKMIIESGHENHLLTEDAFLRDKNSRKILNFENGELVQ